MKESETKNPFSVVVLLSGGLDSAVLLADVLSRTNPHDVYCLSVYYGSKHGILENQKARELAGHYNVAHRTLNIEDVYRGVPSALLRSQTPVPEGHYNADSMKLTVVPGRNMLMIAMATAHAEGLGARRLLIAAHSGDHHIYPDCRPDFFHFMMGSVDRASDGHLSLQVPFMHMTKSQIVQRGLELRVPFSKTRTCYSQDAVACGKCGSCQERLEAFAMLGEEDPLEYKSRELLTK